MKIQGVELTHAHLGKRVLYVDPNTGKAEGGTLSSFNDEAVWVRFLGPSGARCDPERLRWDCGLAQVELYRGPGPHHVKIVPGVDF